MRRLLQVRLICFNNIFISLASPSHWSELERHPIICINCETHPDEKLRATLFLILSENMKTLNHQDYRCLLNMQWFDLIEAIQFTPAIQRQRDSLVGSSINGGSETRRWSIHRSGQSECRGEVRSKIKDQRPRSHYQNWQRIRDRSATRSPRVRKNTAGKEGSEREAKDQTSKFKYHPGVSFQGYCVFNNVAVAAKYAVEKLGLEKVRGLLEETVDWFLIFLIWGRNRRLRHSPCEWHAAISEVRSLDWLIFDL